MSPKSVNFSPFTSMEISQEASDDSTVGVTIASDLPVADTAEVLQTTDHLLGKLENDLGKLKIQITTIR